MSDEVETEIHEIDAGILIETPIEIKVEVENIIILEREEFEQSY